jgi:hypothetical protein
LVDIISQEATPVEEGADDAVLKGQAVRVGRM